VFTSRRIVAAATVSVDPSTPNRFTVHGRQSSPPTIGKFWWCGFGQRTGFMLEWVVRTRCQFEQRGPHLWSVRPNRGECGGSLRRETAVNGRHPLSEACHTISIIAAWKCTQERVSESQGREGDMNRVEVPIHFLGLNGSVSLVLPMSCMLSYIVTALAPLSCVVCPLHSTQRNEGSSARSSNEPTTCDLECVQKRRGAMEERALSAKEGLESGTEGTESNRVRQTENRGRRHTQV
jgi:hypothetical protein